MINRLIDMEIKPIKNNLIISNPGHYTISEYATAFLSGLGETQKERFRQMLLNGIESGMSIARSYGVDYKEFITEVKKQLNVEV